MYRSTRKSRGRRMGWVKSDNRALLISAGCRDTSRNIFVRVKQFPMPDSRDSVCHAESTYSKHINRVWKFTMATTETLISFPRNRYTPKKPQSAVISYWDTRQGLYPRSPWLAAESQYKAPSHQWWCRMYNHSSITLPADPHRLGVWREASERF